MDEAIDPAMTVGVAVQRTAPAVAEVSVDIHPVPLELAAVSVGVAMNAGMAVPLPMDMARGLVAIGQGPAGDYAHRDSDRQRAVVIGLRRRCGQNSNGKRSEQECTHLVSLPRGPEPVRRSKVFGRPAPNIAVAGA